MQLRCWGPDRPRPWGLGPLVWLPLSTPGASEPRLWLPGFSWGGPAMSQLRALVLGAVEGARDPDCPGCRGVVYRGLGPLHCHTPHHSWLSGGTVPARGSDTSQPVQWWRGGGVGTSFSTDNDKELGRLAMQLWDTPASPASPARSTPQPGPGLQCWGSRAPHLTATQGHLGAY